MNRMSLRLVESMVSEYAQQLVERLRHAFVDEPLRVSIETDLDNGIGPSSELLSGRAAALGLRIVGILTSQLDGALEHQCRAPVPGLCCDSHCAPTCFHAFEVCMKCISAIILLVLLAACRTNESPEAQVDDLKITAQVKSKMASDIGVSSVTNISVNSTNGVVTLAGQVDTPAIKAKAVEIARAVPKVTRVVDNLQVTTRPTGSLDVRPVTSAVASILL